MGKYRFKIKRFDPEKENFRWEEFSIDMKPMERVLDGLDRIKDYADGSLTFRRSCGHGICGSCAVKINGRNRLTCQTLIKDMPETIRIEPLEAFPVIKDLVVDLTDFMDKLRSVKPWIIRENKKDDENTSSEYLQTPSQMESYYQQSLCINCTLCYAACPAYGLHSDFLGPAAIALTYRYNNDSRDQGREDRRKVVAAENGVWKCPVVGDCTEVCPKHVDPSAAIQRTKVNSAVSWFFSGLKGGKRE